MTVFRTKDKEVFFSTVRCLRETVVKRGFNKMQVMVGSYGRRKGEEEQKARYPIYLGYRTRNRS